MDRIAGAVDLLPTLAQMAGVSLEGHRPLDGKDLTPLLTAAGRVVEWPDRMLFSHQNGKVSVRTQQYRLDAGSGESDMTADPGQDRGRRRGATRNGRPAGRGGRG